MEDIEGKFKVVLSYHIDVLFPPRGVSYYGWGALDGVDKYPNVGVVNSSVRCVFGIERVMPTPFQYEPKFKVIS